MSCPECGKVVQTVDTRIFCPKCHEVVHRGTYYTKHVMKEMGLPC